MLFVLSSPPFQTDRCSCCRIEVIYSDLSKTIISVSFAGDDLAEATTSISQAHFAPPPVKNNLDALLQWSASLGAQVFAAAHAKLSDKGARGLADRDLVDFCFGRATDPLPPVGATFGVKVYEATVEQGKKAPMVGEDDEPRAGDGALRVPRLSLSRSDPSQKRET